jgi:hypothetical protein
LVRAFQLPHDIAGAVELEPFLGDGGACDVAAQRWMFLGYLVVEGRCRAGGALKRMRFSSLRWLLW